MVTQFIFLAAIVVLAGQRLWELRLSARNEAALRARGGVEHGREHMGWMRLLHTSWLLAMPLEVFLLDRPFIPLLGALALAGLAAGQTLRYAAIRALRERWTVKVIVLPGTPPVTSGLYQRIRHPNYLGVMMEILFVPLLHSAWLTAAVFTALNSLLLRVRVRVEEQALAEANAYEASFAERPRFVP
jgi:methyltransferase